MPYLPCPRDLFLALEVQHAAQLLCMDRYVSSIDPWYSEGIWTRFPTLEEAIAIGNYTLEANDPILSSWASRVAHLRRMGHPSCQYLESLNDALDGDEREKVLRDLDEADASFHANFCDYQPESPDVWPVELGFMIAQPTR